MPEESEIVQRPGQGKSLKQKTGRVLLPVFILGLGIIAGAIVYTSKPPVEAQPPEIKTRTVNTMAVVVSEVSMLVESQGTVEAKHTINLIPQVNGIVTWASEKFVAGGVFAKDELILEIDPRDYELAVISAQATVADARQQLETAKAQSEQAISEWELLERGTPTALALRKPQLAGAEARLKSAEAELLKAELMLERTRITAPYTGILTSKEIDQGQFVSAGNVLGELSSADVMEVRLSLPERELDKIDPYKLNQGGLRVSLTSMSSTGEKIWQGRIVRSEGKIDSRTRNTVVVAEFKNEEIIANDKVSRLTIGQFVRASIEGKDFDKVYELPRVALHNGESVYIVDKDNKLRKRAVTIINMGPEKILIADGLQEGDIVTTSPLTSDVEGLTVNTVVEQESES